MRDICWRRVLKPITPTQILPTRSLKNSFNSIPIYVIVDERQHTCIFGKNNTSQPIWDYNTLDDPLGRNLKNHAGMSHHLVQQSHHRFAQKSWCASKKLPVSWGKTMITMNKPWKTILNHWVSNPFHVFLHDFLDKTPCPNTPKRCHPGARCDSSSHGTWGLEMISLHFLHQKSEGDRTRRIIQWYCRFALLVSSWSPQITSRRSLVWWLPGKKLSELTNLQVNSHSPGSRLRVGDLPWATLHFEPQLITRKSHPKSHGEAFPELDEEKSAVFPILFMQKIRRPVDILFIQWIQPAWGSFAELGHIHNLIPKWLK